MARVSALVNFIEKDQSYLPQAIQEVPYMYVGLFEKGRAFVPQTYSNYTDFETEYGKINSDYPSSLAVYKRMANGKNVSAVRILGKNGYIPSNGYALYSGTTILGILRSTATLSLSGGATVNSFNLGIDVGVSGSASGYMTNLSLVSSNSSNYIKNIVSSIPNIPTTSNNNFTFKQINSSKNLYIDKLYQYAVDALASVTATLSLQSLTSLNSYLMPYSNSSSTMVVSQPLGNQVYDLFIVNTISDGNESVKYKIAIDNIDSIKGRFDLKVRDFSDTDFSPVVLEKWSNLSMDVTSDQFIGKILGDSTYQLDDNGNISEVGNYPNKSRYIYLSEINTVFPTGIAIYPGGFKAYDVVGDASISAYEPQLPMKRNQLNALGNINKNIYFGVDFSRANIIDFLKAKPTKLTKPVVNTSKGFLLFDGIENTSLSSAFYGLNSGAYGSATYNSSTYDASVTSSYSVINKFIFAVKGGFDGFNEELSISNKLDFTKKISGDSLIATNNAYDSIGYSDFKQGIDVISNPDALTFSVLFTCGIYNKEVLQYALDMVEARATAVYIMDIVPPISEIDEVIEAVDNFDSSYGATCYPSIKEKDINSNKYNWIDASVEMSEVMTYNDLVAKPWWASAGITRGKIKNAYVPYKTLDSNQRTLLYSNRINPIAAFTSNGSSNCYIWGNATLQKAESKLSDLNVRRLLNEGKLFIATTIKNLFFDFTDQIAYDEFTSECNKYFESVKNTRGLTYYKVVMDDTTTSADDKDNHIVNGFIAIQPTPTSEQFNITFSILGNNNVTFNDAQ